MHLKTINNHHFDSESHDPEITERSQDTTVLMDKSVPKFIETSFKTLTSLQSKLAKDQSGPWIKDLQFFVSETASLMIETGHLQKAKEVLALPSVQLTVPQANIWLSDSSEDNDKDKV